jgi:hypothetical protein
MRDRDLGLSTSSGKGILFLHDVYNAQGKPTPYRSAEEL